MNIRHILATIVMLMAMLCSMAQSLTGEWKIYPSFNKYVDRVVDTPDKVYFIGQVQEYMSGNVNKGDKFCSLFAYDKQSDEILPLHSGNRISRDLVLGISYNPQGKYLLVVNDDMSIDLLYDDGKSYNISTLAYATLPGKKNIYNISFVPDSDDVYICAEFGYVRLDTQKRQIIESHIYDTPIYDAVRIGKRIALATEAGLYVALESEPRFSLSDYYFNANTTDIRNLLPFDDSNLILVYGRNRFYNSLLYKYKFATPESMQIVVAAEVGKGMIQDLQPLADGWMLRLSAQMMHLKKSDLSSQKVQLHSADYYKPFAASDLETFYLCEPYVGLSKYKVTNGEWTCLKEAASPDAPAPFNSYSAEYSDKYGLLVGSHGIEGRFTSKLSITEPLLLSALKDGFWQQYSPLAFDASLADLGNNFSDLAIDPNEPKYVYRGSLFNGLLRINLDDPTDVMLFGQASHKMKDSDKFVKVFPTQTIWNALCGARCPQFDADGNLVFIYNNYNDQSVDLYSWTAESRKGCKSASDFKGFQSVHLGMVPSNVDNLLVLKHKNNRGKAVVVTGAQSPYLHLVDYNNTLDIASDDKVKSLVNVANQDGAMINLYSPNCLYEDPLTGLVWMGKDTGLFTFNPATFIANPIVNQIKVSRNDGTDLADYLLNNVSVSHITHDGQGRKWISTNGGGVVVTSGDGKKIIAEIKSDNSMLPSDIVNSCHYNPASGSMLINTSLGMAEFTPSGSTTDTENKEVRAYPNPVQPDYYGYVTIDGLPDSCLVKIVDAAGSIVRDLGVVDNGSVQWDVMGMDYKRVKTGVYYILVSGTGTDGESRTGKILVMN